MLRISVILCVFNMCFKVNTLKTPPYLGDGSKNLTGNPCYISLGYQDLPNVLVEDIKTGEFEYALPSETAEVDSKVITLDYNQPAFITCGNDYDLISNGCKYDSLRSGDDVLPAVCQANGIENSKDDDLIRSVGCLPKAKRRKLEEKEKCYEEKGKLIPVGPALKPLYNICFDNIGTKTFYTTHTLKIKAESVDFTKVNSNFKQDFVEELKMEEKYNNQQSIINELLGLSETDPEYVGPRCPPRLHRGHLVPKADFTSKDHRDKTDYYINTDFQWSSINNGNWKRVENLVRANATMQELEIYTGASGIMTLPNKDQTPEEIYMEANNLLPVPAFFWKVAYNKDKSKAVAYLVINNPYDDTYFDKKLSEEDCQHIFEETSKIKGKTYECNVSEKLKEIIPYLPNYKPLELLIFWITCCTLSWTATVLLMTSSLHDFQNNAISFVVDTSYLEWDTNFPSIAVCETDNQDRIIEVTDKTYGDPHDYNLDEIVKEVVFYRGLSFYTLQICGPEAQTVSEDCFKKKFSDFSKEVRSSCDQIFKRCEWSGEEFDCCKYFGELDSEMGVCYAINSIQTKKKTEIFPMVSNIKRGTGTLKLEVKGSANVYVLGAQEVPSLTTLTTDFIQINPRIAYHRYFAIKEIENQLEVKDVSVRQRKCRFEEESNLEVYKYYSYSACSVQCRRNAQLRICGCIHHLMPNTKPELFCNITGLYCLSKHYSELSVLKPYWANRTGLVCDCLPSCTEIELALIKDDRSGFPEDFAVVELTLERLPTERYKRNVVRGKLDLVVSMGGSTALFLGASILSFVEVAYYFLVRPISNYVAARRVTKKSKAFRRQRRNNKGFVRLPTIS